MKQSSAVLSAVMTAIEPGSWGEVDPTYQRTERSGHLLPSRGLGEPTRPSYVVCRWWNQPKLQESDKKGLIMVGAAI